VNLEEYGKQASAALSGLTPKSGLVHLDPPTNRCLLNARLTYRL